MNTLEVDVAVIGAGTAGLAAYRAAVAQGKRTVLIEGGQYGTTCARVGCMPSKLLIAAADAAHMLKAAPAFGVHPGPARIDGRAVMARVRRERDRFVGFVLGSVERIPAADKLRGHARFSGPHTLQVGTFTGTAIGTSAGTLADTPIGTPTATPAGIHTTVHAARIVIATGSTPLRLAQLANGGPGVIVSDDIFELAELPRSLAVIGTGVIGLELGQAMARLGVRVSFFARGGSVAQLTDPEVLHVATKTLGAELDLRFQQQIVGAVEVADEDEAGVKGREEVGDKHGGGRAVLLTTRDALGAERSERFQYVLMATGRAPNLGDIGLEHAGIDCDAAGMPLFDARTMQCGSSHIFIAGDADNARTVLPEAADEGRIAGDNAARHPDVRPGLRRTALTIAFTEPQIATLGATYRQLCAAGQPRFALGMVSFEDQGRSRVMLQNQGLLRVYGEYGSGRFLGAELIGPRAEHLAHLLAWACQARMTVEQMLEMPFYHPVIEEGVRTALRALHAELAKGAADVALAPDAPGA